jgi:hypothetical protein
MSQDRVPFFTPEQSKALAVFRKNEWRKWWNTKPLASKIVSAVFVGALPISGGYELLRGNHDAGVILFGTSGVLVGVLLLSALANVLAASIGWVLRKSGIAAFWSRIRDRVVSAFVALFWIFLSIIILVAIWPYLSLDPVKSWYALKNAVPVQRVEIDKKPHDCEFTTAPLGHKNCHYDPVIAKIMWSTSPSGDSIKSADGGKTWETHVPGKCDFDVTLNCPNIFDPEGGKAPQNPTVTGLIISWQKVQD